MQVGLDLAGWTVRVAEMSLSNPPVKHHYTPQFLLAEWAVQDGKLWRFNNAYANKLAKKLVAPAEIGYEKHLYALPGLPPEAMQQIEEKIMAPLDALASDTHELLLQDKIHGMPQKQRSAWSRFIMSQWFRTPEGVKAFKAAMGSLLSKEDPALEARYQTLRKDGYPATLDAAIAALNPHFAEQAALQVMCRMMDDPQNGLRLNNMGWFVRDIHGENDLLVSDVLLQQSSAVLGSTGYITMPIAPRKLFFAVHRQDFADQILAMPEDDLVSRVNRMMVRQASEYVGSTSLAHEAFIEEHFGQEDSTLLVKDLAKKYAETSDQM